MIEEPLPPQTVVGGAILDQEKFSSSLKNLVKKAPLKLHYVIVSLPADTVYSKIFSLPDSIRGTKLEEAMNLTIGFQLPVKLENVYLDWEKINDVNQNKIFLAAAPKSIIDTYVKMLHDIGLSPIAIEFHPLSFLRTIDIQETNSVLLKSSSEISAAVFIVKNRNLIFSRVLPEKFVGKAKLGEEVAKIVNFYEAEKEKISAVLDLNDCKILKTYAADNAEVPPGKWMISLGAAVRGLIPRSEDDLVSLMPIGTQQAYGYLKAMVFSEFLVSVTAGVAIFFVAAFAGVWLFMNGILQKTARDFNALQASISIPQDAITLESRAAEINSLLGTMGEIVKRTPKWSVIFDEFRQRLTPGIATFGFNVSSADGSFQMTGTSQTREQLASFKKSMESSEIFSQIKLNISDIAAKTNVAFSMYFGLKDPKSLYVYNENVR